MKAIFLISFFLTTFAYGKLEKLKVTELDLDYAREYGQGVFTRLDIGIKSQNPKYPIEIFRQPESFLIETPFISLEWLGPLTFLHNAQIIKAKELNLNLAKLNHSASGAELEFKSENGTEIKLENFMMTCSGQSTESDVLDRAKEDCFQKAYLNAKKVNLPFGFVDFLEEFSAGSPLIDTANVVLGVNEQKFNLSMNVRYVISATLRANGKMELQDEGKILGIRLDSVKFGIMPITSLVFFELRRNESQTIKVDPPWIKIRL